MQEDLIFNYDETLSMERNFSLWFMMNCAERAEFGEQVYTQKEGLKVFKENYSNRIADGG
tara:strand:+ start:10028 stop:10207 length:180 start_codon:yes stop_codon:yes gene_type:complete